MEETIVKKADRMEKVRKAEEIIRACLSPGNGVFASPDRYLFQCWTRDLALAVAPLLLKTGEAEIVRVHLENLSMRQRENGQIPILFLSDEEAWRKKKVAERGTESFMVQRYDAGELWNLTPGTKDSEILYAIAMHEYVMATDDQSLLDKYGENITRAIAYVEKNNFNRDGLAVGTDWRDTMEVLLADRALLTNNVLLVHAYELMGENDKADALKERILEHFWLSDSIIDYLPGGFRPDPLGLALAVLHDVAPKQTWPLIKKLFDAVDTSCGVTIKCIHNPYVAGEQEVFDRTEGVVVWPFVAGFAAMALSKMGYRADAMKMFAKLENLEGFYEWYDPATGKGWGAPEQLWSATLYLRTLYFISE